MTRKRLKPLNISAAELKAPSKPRPARKVIAERIKDWEKFAHTHINATAAKATEEREEPEEESDEDFEEESDAEFIARREAFIQRFRERVDDMWLDSQGYAKQVLNRLASIQSRLDAFESSREPGELMEAMREAAKYGPTKPSRATSR